MLNVLREAGLTQDDVEFVEMQSVDDAFSVALASKQVDVAPLGQTLVKTYLAKYEQDGATTIAPGVRDDAWTLYTPTTVLEDADKAAAIKEYVAAWAKAQQWISDNPDEFAEAYYVDHEGLSPEDAQYVVDALGQFTVPTAGTSSSPATRRPWTRWSRRRTRSRWTWRRSTTAATRRRSRPRWRAS